jgi:hypothetical protein
VSAVPDGDKPEENFERRFAQLKLMNSSTKR